MSHQNLLLTIFEASFILVLIIGLLYTYIIKNPSYFYFYIGIVMGSVIVAFVIPIILIILIPEIIYLSYLSQRRMSATQIYAKMRSQRWYLSRGLRMNDVWNPKNTRNIVQLNDKEKLQKKYSMWTMGIITFICTLGFLITSILTLIFYFF